MGVDVNLIPKRIWENLGRSTLEPTPYNISLENGSKMKTLGTWRQVKVNFKGVKKVVDFQVVTIQKTFDSFDSLLRLRWFVDSCGVINARKEEISFVDDRRIVHIPLEKNQDENYIEEVNA